LDVATFADGLQTGTHATVPFFAYEGAFALPTADARHICILDALVNRAFSATKATELGSGGVVPALEPGFFLTIASKPPHNRGVTETAVFTDEVKLLFHVRGLDELRDTTTLPWEKRLFYYPRSGLLVTLAGSKDRLILRRVELAEQLEKSDTDYLVVVSRPPLAKAGTAFAYRLDIRSRKGGAAVKLESGPAGLNVTAAGEVSWNVPADIEEQEAEVVVTVRDKSGQETLHRFAVEIAPRQ
jgi:hypothetical protein